MEESIFSHWKIHSDSHLKTSNLRINFQRQSKWIFFYIPIKNLICFRYEWRRGDVHNKSRNDPHKLTECLREIFLSQFSPFLMPATEICDDNEQTFFLPSREAVRNEMWVTKSHAKCCCRQKRKVKWLMNGFGWQREAVRKRFHFIFIVVSIFHSELLSFFIL